MRSIVTTAFKCLMLFGQLAGGHYRNHSTLTLDHAGFVGKGIDLVDEVTRRIEKSFIFAPPDGGKVTAGMQVPDGLPDRRSTRFVPLENRRQVYEPISIQGQKFQSLAVISPGYMGMPEGSGFVAYVAADLNGLANLWRDNVNFTWSTLYGRPALRIDLDSSGLFLAYVVDQNLSDTMKQLTEA